jgi:hypothetical protein
MSARGNYGDSALKFLSLVPELSALSRNIRNTRDFHFDIRAIVDAYAYACIEHR